MSGIQNSEPIWLIFICGKLFKKLSPSLFVLCKMINPHFTTEKIKNLLTFLYSKNHIILHAKDKIKDYI